jgi:hypothetical protein
MFGIENIHNDVKQKDQYGVSANKKLLGTPYRGVRRSREM